MSRSRVELEEELEAIKVLIERCIQQSKGRKKANSDFEIWNRLNIATRAIEDTKEEYYLKDCNK